MTVLFVRLPVPVWYSAPRACTVQALCYMPRTDTTGCSGAGDDTDEGTPARQPAVIIIVLCKLSLAQCHNVQLLLSGPTDNDTDGRVRGTARPGKGPHVRPTRCQRLHRRFLRFREKLYGKFKKSIICVYTRFCPASDDASCRRMTRESLPTQSTNITIFEFPQFFFFNFSAVELIHSEWFILQRRI